MEHEQKHDTILHDTLIENINLIFGQANKNEFCSKFLEIGKSKICPIQENILQS